MVQKASVDSENPVQQRTRPSAEVRRASRHRVSDLGLLRKGIRGHDARRTSSTQPGSIAPRCTTASEGRRASTRRRRAPISTSPRLDCSHLCSTAPTTASPTCSTSWAAFEAGSPARPPFPGASSSTTWRPAPTPTRRSATANSSTRGLRRALVRTGDTDDQRRAARAGLLSTSVLGVNLVSKMTGGDTEEIDRLVVSMIDEVQRWQSEAER